MKSSIKMWTRRRVLRGMLAGGAVTVGLPILDCVLNDNGTAFADTGAPLPTRFASWFWPCGIGEQEWRPEDGRQRLRAALGDGGAQAVQEAAESVQRQQVFSTAWPIRPTSPACRDS